MPWIHLHIHTDPDQAEILEDLLLAAGSAAVTMQDQEDQPLYEPELGSTPLWQSTRVTGLFDAGADVESLKEQIAADFHQQTQSALEHIEVELVADQDWERAWMDDFHPIPFGERLWICPSWHTPPQEDAVNLMLDPGLAFGTGTHPTTALCLKWLDGEDVTDLEVVDYGCGSGVLGLAALLLGASTVLGTDTDPQALDASRENARRNQIAEERLQLFVPESMPDSQCDLLLANILAQPLMSLAPALAQRVRPDGRILLSGILASQAEELISRYSDWFAMAEAVEQDGWVRLEGRRRA
ncbi:MAG: 50S ribosomal protein L11 methyltransferase [Halomonadaceae bacterium]|nr:MAG: 50S ribosomal protein L11 methyltransferase [Halomonadaceae bacterium]